jgi:hypothetical protein
LYLDLRPWVSEVSFLRLKYYLGPGDAKHVPFGLFDRYSKALAYLPEAD